MVTLNNSVVLVTGANGGLGAEFVQQALDRGAARVYATARTPRSWGDPRVVPLALDVTKADSIAAAAATADDVTLVVNNAGATIAGGILDAPMADVRALFETNVFAPLQVARAFAPILASNDGGAIIDVHSALSWLGRGGVYSATKAAFWSVTNSLRLELLAQGTQVLGAHLGYTDTPMIAQLDVPKSDPAEIIAAIYDGLEAGEHEVLADETSRLVKGGLSAPLSALYPELR
jgi:NAD(P)-dependent dehydrogenase (short-subunit alcohol dehydrogenase family)